MHPTARKLQIACFAFSIITVLFDLTLLIVRVALAYTGFDITTIVPVCTSPYLLSKLSQIYLPLRAHTICSIIALLLSISIFILCFRSHRKLSQQQSLGVDVQKLKWQCNTELLYCLVSVECMLLALNAGGAISVLIDNSSCVVVEGGKWMVLVVVGVGALGLGLVQLGLVVGLDQYKEVARQMVHLGDVRGDDVQRMEQEMSDQLKLEAKDYMSSNNHKDDMLQGLLRNQQQIFERSQNNGQHGNKQQTFDKARGGMNGIGGQINANERQFQLNSQNEHEQLDNADGKNSLQRQQERMQKKSQKMGRLYKNSQKLQDGQFISYDLGLQMQDQAKGAFEQNDQQQIKQDKNKNKKMRKNSLSVVSDDNLSQKFDQCNFQLLEDLNKAIAEDKQEDLSPLELMQQMYLTKDGFRQIEGDISHLKYQKNYEVAGSKLGLQPEKYKININFQKIKEYKVNQKKQIQAEQQAVEKARNARINEQAQKPQQKKEEVKEQPIDQNLLKDIRVMLFSKNDYYKRNRLPDQSECPISKYVQKDDRLQILQPDSKFKGKNRKMQYSRQQVAFVKKRKDESKQDQMQKGSIRQQFNESEFVKIQQAQLFGEEWALQRRRQQAQKQQINKTRKRKIVQVIRSKYAQ